MNDVLDIKIGNGSLPNSEAVIAFEEGLMTEQQIIEFFQHGISREWVWGLQGFYVRFARELIALGLCEE